jgi:hypothetical protein
LTPYSEDELLMKTERRFTSERPQGQVGGSGELEHRIYVPRLGSSASQALFSECIEPRPVCATTIRKIKFAYVANKGDNCVKELCVVLIFKEALVVPSPFA